VDPRSNYCRSSLQLLPNLCYDYYVVSGSEGPNYYDSSLPSTKPLQLLQWIGGSTTDKLLLLYQTQLLRLVDRRVQLHPSTSANILQHYTGWIPRVSSRCTTTRWIPGSTCGTNSYVQLLRPCDTAGGLRASAWLILGSLPSCFLFQPTVSSGNTKCI
jgi:hypothetical protein